MRNAPGGFDSHTLPWVAATLSLFVVLALPARLSAQDEVPREPPAGVLPDSAAAPSLVAEPANPDTARSGPGPMSAFFRSLVVPGWGQLAADRPIRGLFSFTMQAGTVAMIVRTQNRINAAEARDPDAGIVKSRKEQREDWIALAVFWSLASAVDAWVSAHMWGFEGEVVPPPDGSSGIALQVRVPVGGF